MNSVVYQTLSGVFADVTKQVSPRPLFPLQRGIWYKAKNGMFARLRTDTDAWAYNGKLYPGIDYWKDRSEPRHDYWGVKPENGECLGDGADWNIVSFADEEQASSFLPLRVGIAYRARNGQKVELLAEESGPWQTGKYCNADGSSGNLFSITVADGIVPGTDGTYNIVGLWEEPKKVPLPPNVPDASGLIKELMTLNKDVIEASCYTVAEKVLAAYREGLRKDIMVDIANAIEKPIEEIICEQMAKNTFVREIVIKDRAEVRTVNSPHPKLEEAIEISRAINNIWLCGPAGSGKTTLAQQLAEAMGRQFSFISCTAGMSESKLLGRMNVQGAYLSAEFVKIYEEGGVFLWDEFDAADPNVVLCANAAMANGRLSVPDRIDNPVALRHPDTILVVATNTWGRGATGEYSARESLDAATRDRFVLSKVEVDYSPNIEFQFLGKYKKKANPKWKAPSLADKELASIFVDIRHNINKHHLRRVMSTRAFAQAAALRAIGWDDKRIIEQYFLDWTEQERTKALEGVF